MIELKNNVNNIEMGGKVINQGLDTSIITTNTYETKEINPDYKNIAKSSAITGAIAGGMVVAGKWLSTKPNGKPKLDRPTEGATLKPDQSIVNDPQVISKHPNYGSTGTTSVNANNVGTANLTTDPSLVGMQVKDAIKQGAIKPPSWLFGEGSWSSNLVSQIPGMNGMATSIHDPLSQLFFTSNTVPQIVNDILIVASILPSIPASYCIISPSACASIINNKPIKPSGNNLPNLPEKPKSIMFKEE